MISVFPLENRTQTSIEGRTRQKALKLTYVRMRAAASISDQQRTACIYAVRVFSRSFNVTRDVMLEGIASLRKLLCMRKCIENGVIVACRNTNCALASSHWKPAWLWPNVSSRQTLCALCAHTLVSRFGECIAVWCIVAWCISMMTPRRRRQRWWWSGRWWCYSNAFEHASVCAVYYSYCVCVCVCTRAVEVHCAVQVCLKGALFMGGLRRNARWNVSCSNNTLHVDISCTNISHWRSCCRIS